MAGSITVTPTDLGGALTKYTISWTADGSGAVSGNAFSIRRGRLWGVKFTAGSPAPAAGYSAKLIDADGADLLWNLGVTVASPGYATLPAGALFIEGFAAVTPTIDSAGAAAQGSLIVYVGP